MVDEKRSEEKRHALRDPRSKLRRIALSTAAVRIETMKNSRIVSEFHVVVFRDVPHGYNVSNSTPFECTAFRGISRHFR